MEKWCRGSRERTVKTTSEHGRELSTPEGLSLRLRVAYTSERLVALLIDVAIVLGATQALSMFCQLLAAGHAGKELITVIWTLGFFVLRNLYFAFFEIRPIAASPGKRLLRLRVVSRDGGKLTVDAVFLRGLTREFELWIPYLVFRYSSWDVVSRLSDLFWVVVFLCVPLLSPDRTRVGDLIAGTCVVAVPRSGLRDQTRFATRAA